MNIALRLPQMTREAFFDWAQAREGRYEFDGVQPVAMTGGTIDHNVITLNIHRSLHQRLQGTGCRALGQDAGVATIGDAVRYPDALVTCTKGSGTDRLVPGVVVVFEVLSASVDRIDKLIEYRAVSSIRRYVILEHASIALTVFARDDGDAEWTATALTGDDILHMPDLGIEIPVREFYEGVDLS